VFTNDINDGSINTSDRRNLGFDRYPSQCQIFSLQPEYVTLREKNGEWHYDFDELKRAVEGGATPAREPRASFVERANVSKLLQVPSR